MFSDDKMRKLLESIPVRMEKEIKKFDQDQKKLEREMNKFDNDLKNDIANSRFLRR